MRRLSILALILALCVLGAACKSDKPPKLNPLPGNSELVVGPNRFAVGFVDANNEPVLGPGNSVHFQFIDPNDVAKEEVDARFVWGIQDVNGYWVANVNFDIPGSWVAGTTVDRGGKKTSLRIGFPVAEHGSAPKIGDAAPPADNLTLAQDPNIKRLSTDPQPDIDFYQMTVTQALDAKKPFVVIFATPLFCQTQFCGPVLNDVKSVAADFKSKVNFIHIEPFNLNESGQLATDPSGAPVAAPPTDQWKLQTEPWVFVVGADGKVADRFESTITAEELRAALQQVAG